MSSPALSRQLTPAHAAHPATGLRAAAPPPRSGEAAPQALRLTGRYRYDRGTSAWWWSAEMFALHGLATGAVEPSTDVLLRHQDPDDRDRVLAALTAACAGQPFTVRTRLALPDGGRREVVLVGDPRLDAQGTVTGVDGMCIDLTECPPAGTDPEEVVALRTEVEQLRAAMASRATIEQAKGILMLLTSCSDKVAFDLLTHISSHTHRKVRDVAQSITESASGHARLPDDVRSILRDACPPEQSLS
ncbi:MAG: ANTAR domain-containing protein [Blastococcus sp.]